MTHLKHLPFLFCAFFVFGFHSHAQNGLAAGFFYDSFPLTLEAGQRTEIAGPFYYFETRETQQLWGVPPLFSRVTDPSVEMEEWDVLYPLASYDRYGEEYRLHLLQILSLSGGQSQEGAGKARFTFFPFYFQQRSPEPDANYTAFLPFHGTLKNRFFRDQIHFALLPLYVKSWKKDVVTENYVYPFFHLRHGDGLQGWQFWPLLGREEKAITTKTNSAAEVQIIGGHEKFFALWPLFFKNHLGIGTDHPQQQLMVLPFYASSDSPQRTSTSYGWPLGVTLTDDRDKKFREVGAPWPLVVFARGEGKRVSRVWPLFSRASNTNRQSDFYLWPIYKYNRLQSAPLERERTRLLFFLYSDVTQKNTETGETARRVDFWPFFTKRRDLHGNERLQVLSVLEPLLPEHKSIERNYAPLWSLYRSEKNVKSSFRSRSFLWNFYRCETTPDTKKVSALFGLVQFQRDETGQHWRFFHLPTGRNQRRDGKPHPDVAK